MIYKSIPKIKPKKLFREILMKILGVKHKNELKFDNKSNLNEDIEILIVFPESNFLTVNIK